MYGIYDKVAISFAVSNKLISVKEYIIYKMS